MFCQVAAIAAPAQTFNVLYNFDVGPNDPHGNATAQGRDGNMHSTTPQVWRGRRLPENPHRSFLSNTRAIGQGPA
jgi:hypothetical protein